MSKIRSAQSSTFTPNPWIDPHPALNGISIMDHLFNRLDGFYPTRWRAAFASVEAIDNWRSAWADGFEAEGITLAEIRIGISECRRRYDWPPSFAEFLKACRTPIDYESAFFEAVEQMHKRKSNSDRWSSPAIYWAAARIGSDIFSIPYPAIRNRWKAEMEKAELMISEGELPASVPKRLDALPAPGKCSMPSDEARRKIAEMIKGIGSMPERGR